MRSAARVAGLDAPDPRAAGGRKLLDRLAP